MDHYIPLTVFWAEIQLDTRDQVIPAIKDSNPRTGADRFKK